MTGLPLILILLILIGALVGAGSVIFTPVLAIPIGLFLIALVGIWELTKRRRTSTQRMEELREEADSDRVEFTERDRQTLA
ncbi:MAG TPA: hypothetical protein VF752_02635 [Thermoleophilaceae bacterium]